MAAHLDLEEQEQLAQFKHFWNRWGNLITWLLIAVLAVYAGWNGYQYWQRSESAKAAALYDELERATAAQDLSRVERSLSDIQSRYGRTAYAVQGALLSAQTLQELKKPEAARAALVWAAEHAGDEGLRDVARLRLASLWLDAASPDEAQKVLAATFTAPFAPLADDLRGDVLMAQKKPAEAISAYTQAFQNMTAMPEYRRLVQAKLNALGVNPETKESK